VHCTNRQERSLCCGFLGIEAHASAGIDEIGNEIEEPFSILPLKHIVAKSGSDITELMNKMFKNSDFKKNIDISYELDALKRI
jgi:hypothetical protein